MNWILIVGIIVAVGVFFLIWHATESAWLRHAREHMAGRPSRSSLEFGEEFYPDRASIAADVRDIFAKHIEVDISQILPSDQPVRDLHMGDMDSLATEEFVIELEKHFGIKILDADAQRMRTIDEVVRYVIAKVDEKSGRDGQ